MIKRYDIRPRRKRATEVRSEVEHGGQVQAMPVAADSR
jgi:hypothetical protein